MSDWQVIHGDCLEVLRTLPAGSVDAVVTDPPYGIDHDTDYTRFVGGLADNRADWRPVHNDSEPFDPKPWLAFPRVVMFGFNCFSNHLPLGSLLVWNKRRDSQLGTFLADAEVAWMNKGHGVYLFNHVWHGFDKASERGVKRVHPTQKPVEVMKWAMDRAGIPAGATVLDPYCGSGTTGVACSQTGRNFIGIEIDEAYCTIARRRISEAAALFHQEVA